MLIVFSGLPGTGKTTIAKALADRTRAFYVRIDTIEQAIRNARVLANEVGRSGYDVANEIALSNLCFGNTVVIDCVNPVAESRNAWADIASRAGVSLLNVLVVCSDVLEHRKRVETRLSDIPGLTPPTWQSVLDHDFEVWGEAPFTLDTASMSPEQAIEKIVRHLSSMKQYRLPPALSAPDTR